MTFDHRGVVVVGREHPAGAFLGALLDELEERLFALLAVDDELGVEDFVAAMFAVGLREHHELDVGRMPPEGGIARHEVIDLVFGEGQTEALVGAYQRASPGREVDAREGLRLGAREELFCLVSSGEQRLGHTVVQRQLEALGIAEGARDRPHDAALDPSHRVEPAIFDDVGRLRRPRGNRPEARHDEQLAPADGREFDARPVIEQLIEHPLRAVCERPRQVDEVYEARARR